MNSTSIIHFLNCTCLKSASFLKHSKKVYRQNIRHPVLTMSNIGAWIIGKFPVKLNYPMYWIIVLNQQNHTLVPLCWHVHFYPKILLSQLSIHWTRVWRLSVTSEVLGDCIGSRSANLATSRNLRAETGASKSGGTFHI